MGDRWESFNCNVIKGGTPFRDADGKPVWFKHGEHAGLVAHLLNQIDDLATMCMKAEPYCPVRVQDMIRAIVKDASPESRRPASAPSAT